MLDQPFRLLLERELLVFRHPLAVVFHQSLRQLITAELLVLGNPLAVDFHQALGQVLLPRLLRRRHPFALVLDQTLLEIGFDRRGHPLALVFDETFLEIGFGLRRYPTSAVIHQPLGQLFLAELLGRGHPFALVKNQSFLEILFFFRRDPLAFVLDQAFGLLGAPKPFLGGEILLGFLDHHGTGQHRRPLEVAETHERRLAVVGEVTEIFLDPFAADLGALRQEITALDVPVLDEIHHAPFPVHHVGCLFLGKTGCGHPDAYQRKC